MASLKIQSFKGEYPETTITIPVGILKIASKLIPTQAAEALKAQGIDLEEIVQLSNNPEAHGVLVEVEEHLKNEKLIVTLE